MQRYGTKPSQPRIVQIMAAPWPVFAVYRDYDGSEIRERVYLIGLNSEGDCCFLVADDCGLFDSPDALGNFVKYEWGT